MPVQTAAPRTRRGHLSRPLAMALAVAVLAVAVAAGLALGSKAIPLPDVVAALFGRPGDAEVHGIVIGLRLPRTAAGLVVGAALGLAGALIQAITRNPLADPGLLGVNAGAAFAVALAVGLLGVARPGLYVLFAFAGALATTAAVFALGEMGHAAAPGSRAARMVLAGMALGAVLTGLVGAIRLSDRQAFNAMTAWEIGNLSDRGWDVIAPLAPFAAVGAAVALGLGPALDALALGEETGAALGVHVARTRLAAVAAIALLAGSATALAGPVGFVGLAVPHLARWAVGPSQPWILSLSALLGPALVLAADIAGRLIARPGEVQVAIGTALIGAPVLIGLARGKRVVTL